MSVKLTRRPEDLQEKEFDLLVIGGGIHGTCVARDAALRGLSVALIERGDFGSETSHNSLKLIHGGIRYLQHLDLGRIRESVLERRFWLSCARHLVRPIKFVIPTYGHGVRGALALGVATKLFGLLSWDRNRDLPESQHIGGGGLMSRADVIRDLPGIKQDRLTGAAYWHDGQVIDADRAMLEIVQSASTAGAVVCNYVSAKNLIRHVDTICGVTAIDVISGNELEIRAKVTINAAGPWANEITSWIKSNRRVGRLSSLSKCMNIIVRRPEHLDLPDYGFGVISERKSDSLLDASGRMFFVTPWKGLSIIGTSHLPCSENPDDVSFTNKDIDDFLDEVNAAYPFRLTSSDVLYCYGGLTPAEEGTRRGQVKRARHGEIIDHLRDDSVDGLITLIGVKFTTARLVAERAVDLALKKLGRDGFVCQTANELLVGATEGDAVSDHFWAQEDDNAGCIDMDGFESMIRDAVRNQMAMKISDIIDRRTDLAEMGHVTRDILKICANTIGSEQDWTANRRQAELEQALKQYKLIAKDSADTGNLRSTPQPS